MQECFHLFRLWKSNRYYKNNAKLLLQLESKQEAKAKGHPSPDRADAAVLAWANIPYPCEFITGDLSQDENKDKENTKQEALSAEELLQWHYENLHSGYRNRRPFRDNSKELVEPVTQGSVMQRLEHDFKKRLVNN